MPTGWLRLKWMLPSPKWPKAQTRMPGSAASQAPVAASMNAATRRHRHGHVVLDGAAFPVLHLRQVLAQAPQGGVLCSLAPMVASSAAPSSIACAKVASSKP
jgi:hypothetical protein